MNAIDIWYFFYGIGIYVLFGIAVTLWLKTDESIDILFWPIVLLVKMIRSIINLFKEVRK